jgi:hypothetical protein
VLQNSDAKLAIVHDTDYSILLTVSVPLCRFPYKCLNGLEQEGLRDSSLSVAEVLDISKPIVDVDADGGIPSNFLSCVLTADISSQWELWFLTYNAHSRNITRPGGLRSRQTSQRCMTLTTLPWRPMTPRDDCRPSLKLAPPCFLRISWLFSSTMPRYVSSSCDWMMNRQSACLK